MAQDGMKRQPRRKHRRTRRKRRSCRGKVRYRDHAEAVRALRTIEQADDRRQEHPTKSYPCPHCHGVHLART